MLIANVLIAILCFIFVRFLLADDGDSRRQISSDAQRALLASRPSRPPLFHGKRALPTNTEPAKSDEENDPLASDPLWQELCQLEREEEETNRILEAINSNYTQPDKYINHK